MISDPKHPIWPILKQIVPATVIVLLCCVMYNTGLVPKDLLLPVGASLASLAVSWIKNIVTK